MSDQDVYEAWLASKRREGVPAGFAARVMDAVRAEQPQSEGHAWWDHAWLRAGAWAAASLLLLVRLVALAALLWPS